MKNQPILLKIIAIREIRPSAYVVLLSNIAGTQKLPIVIGAPEARAIAFSLEGLKSERPITHDLFISLLNSFDIEMEKVTIVKLDRGIYYAAITLKRGDTVINIDARPSDAIAIALRFKRPIFCNQEIMNSAAIDTRDDDESFGVANDIQPQEPDFSQLTLKELEAEMNRAAHEENYEMAAKIKKIIEEKQAEQNQEDKEDSE